MRLGRFKIKIGRKKKKFDVRPVELAELDQSKLDIARLVLEEGFAEKRDAVLDGLDGRELQGGNVGFNHDGGQIGG